MLGREQTPGAPRPRRKWTLWASLAIVGVVVSMGVTVGVVKSQTPSTESAPAPQSEPTQPATSGCPAGREVDEGRLDVAPDAQWVSVGQMTFPVTPGQQSPASGVWECFEHTPEGAVLSASAAAAQLSSPTNALRTAVMERRVAPGPVQDSMLEAVATAAEPEISTDGARVRISGFRLVEYTGDTARVDVVFTAATSGMTINMAMLIPLAWDEERGDWLLNYSESDQYPPAQLPNLAGYVLWPNDGPGVVPGG